MRESEASKEADQRLQLLLLRSGDRGRLSRATAVISARCYHLRRLLTWTNSDEVKTGKIDWCHLLAPARSESIPGKTGNERVVSDGNHFARVFFGVQ